MITLTLSDYAVTQVWVHYVVYNFEAYTVHNRSFAILCYIPCDNAVTIICQILSEKLSIYWFISAASCLFYRNDNLDTIEPIG